MKLWALVVYFSGKLLPTAGLFVSLIFMFPKRTGAVTRSAAHFIYNRRRTLCFVVFCLAAECFINAVRVSRSAESRQMNLCDHENGCVTMYCIIDKLVFKFT